ncbi:site-specific integrase, partial [Treponema pallidum]
MSNEQFTQYLEYLFRVRRLSAHTVSAYARDLNLFERWLQHAQRACARVTVSDMRLFVCELG